MCFHLHPNSVVGAVGVEGRVEVDQIDGFGRDVAPQDIEIVAVVEGVLHADSAGGARKTDKFPE